jgi:4-amino-4-deoxy-L-arabinose transferase-like glycosyltransferase
MVAVVFDDSGKKSFRAWWGLLIFTLALLILSVWGLELSGRDSPRVAGIAREMAVTSGYLVPRLNGEKFLQYPPLGYWPIAFALSISKNPPEFLAFLPFVLLGTGTVLVTYLIGRKLAGEKIALMAGFILSTMPSFISYHQHCRVDPALLFLITLSLYGFVAAYNASPSPLPPSLEGEGRVGGKRVFFFTLFYLAMAGAFLSKGIIGAAIPAATVVVFLITRKDFKAIRRLLLNPALLFFFLPVFLWVGGVGGVESLGIFEEIIRESLFRFLSPSAAHAKPFYYYFTRVLTAPLPWTILLFPLIWHRWRPAPSREPLPHGSLLWFALVWLLVGLIGLSFASAKRSIYLGPLYPSFAFLSALGWDRLREKFPKVKRLEVYGLIVIFFLITAVNLLWVIPSERKESLRPVFEVVSSQQTKGPIYLVDPSEATRGAAFFYLGERIPLLNKQDLLQGRFEDRSGITLMLDLYCGDNQISSSLLSKGFHMIFQKKFGKDEVCIYSNSP